MTGYRTYAAALVALLAELANLAGARVSIAEQEGLGNALAVLIGTSAAIYFRYKAEQRARAERLIEKLRAERNREKE